MEVINESKFLATAQRTPSTIAMPRARFLNLSKIKATTARTTASSTPRAASAPRRRTRARAAR